MKCFCKRESRGFPLRFSVGGEFITVLSTYLDFFSPGLVTRKFLVQITGGSTLPSLSHPTCFIYFFLLSTDKPSRYHTDGVSCSDTNPQAGCLIDGKGAPLEKSKGKQEGEVNAAYIWATLRTFKVCPIWLS